MRDKSTEVTDGSSGGEVATVDGLLEVMARVAVIEVVIGEAVEASSFCSSSTN